MEKYNLHPLFALHRSLSSIPTLILAINEVNVFPLISVVSSRSLQPCLWELLSALLAKWNLLALQYYVLIYTSMSDNLPGGQKGYNLIF